MNCPGCNAAIDYKFVSSCPQCGFEEVPAGAELENRPAAKCDEGDTKALTFKRALANSTCVLAVAFTGLVVGAFLAYFMGGLVYLLFFAGKLTGGEACARGTAVAVLSILSGSFLGTVGGSVFAAKHLIRKF